MNKQINYYIDINQLDYTIKEVTNKLNINKWDIGASISYDLSAQIQNGEAKQLKSSQKSSATIRVWNNQGLVGITSTSDYSDEGLKMAFKGAYEASRYGNKQEIPDFSPLSKDLIPEDNSYNYSKIPDIKVLIEKLKVAVDELINSNEYINSIPYNGISEMKIERIYLNSQGSKRQMGINQSSIYLYAKAEQNNRKPRSSGAVEIANLIEDLDIKKCIDVASDKTLSHLNYEPIETGSYLTCFSPESFIQLISAFSSLFNARSIIDGVSLTSRNDIGNVISVPFLSISDESLSPHNKCSFNFDGEGTPTQNIELIKGGKLINFIHSEATAKLFGVKPTGHAGLGSKVSVGNDWLVIRKTEGIQATKNFLKVDNEKSTFVLIDTLNALHAGIKASQGSFSLPFDGWLVKDGKKISIEAATIAGDIRNVLKNIVQIENKEIVTHTGISPHVWIENLKITGEA